jgi:hypothetical protein
VTCRGPPVVSGSRLTNRGETDGFVRLLTAAFIFGSPSPTLLTSVKAIRKEPLRRIAHRRACDVPARSVSKATGAALKSRKLAAALIPAVSEVERSCDGYKEFPKSV